MRNVNLFRIVLVIGVIALLAACEETAPESNALPTLMELPSLTPTETASVTPLPTETFTPEATSTPTVTTTPSATFTTTSTATPTRTNTATRTAQPTATATSSQTNTPEVQPTESFPTITSFSASSTDVAGGGQLTLRWEASGDEAHIDQQDANGLVMQTTPVQVSGELSVTVPNTQAGKVFFRLVVKRGPQEVTQTVEIRVQVQCTINWFFGNEFVVNENVGCPPAASQQVVGAYQPFESGFMVNLNIDAQNLMYALVRAPGKNSQYVGDQYGSLVNRWDGASNSCAGTPPVGTVLPTQQFGWMACTQFALGGFWIDGIGYATASVDFSARIVQRASDGSLFIDAPDGTIYRLNPLLPGALTATWKRIK